MKIKICVMTGTRADYGLLRPLLMKLKSDNDFELKLLVTGTHLSSKFGKTQSEIISDGFSFNSIPIEDNEDSKLSMAVSMGAALSSFAKYFAEIKPDILVLLGDRFEAFAAASAAYTLSVPIAHISGGDVTEGALDDGFRHCITKMSSVHFPGCDDSARRIIQMGEQPETVFPVGDPGIEICLSTQILPLDELSKSLNFNLEEGRYAVVTFHSATLEYDNCENQVSELIKAISKHKEIKYIVTASNSDAGGRKINEILINKASESNNMVFVPSLGSVRYLSAIKHCAMILGNSSSGIVEGPVFGVPTVNIGSRQKGRPAASSVINCEPKAEAIDKAMNLALTNEFRLSARKCKSLFGQGNTSEEIVNIIKKLFYSNRLTIRKSFYDLDIDQ